MLFCSCRLFREYFKEREEKQALQKQAEKTAAPLSSASSSRSASSLEEAEKLETPDQLLEAAELEPPPPFSTQVTREREAPEEQQQEASHDEGEEDEDDLDFDPIRESSRGLQQLLLLSPPAAPSQPQPQTRRDENGTNGGCLAPYSSYSHFSPLPAPHHLPHQLFPASFFSSHQQHPQENNLAATQHTTNQQHLFGGYPATQPQQSQCQSSGMVRAPSRPPPGVSHAAATFPNHHSHLLQQHLLQQQSSTATNNQQQQHERLSSHHNEAQMQHGIGRDNPFAASQQQWNSMQTTTRMSENHGTGNPSAPLDSWQESLLRQMLPNVSIRFNKKLETQQNSHSTHHQQHSSN